MTPGALSELTIDGGYLPVNAEMIERRLIQIWKQAAADKLEGISSTKICLANILIIADTQSRREAEALTFSLASAHPSRVFLTVIDDDSAAYQAYVRTSCTRNKETGQVRCWEVIEIEVDRSRVGLTAGAIRSLLVDSVPVVAVDFRPYQTTPEFDGLVLGLADFFFVNAEVVPANPAAALFLTLRWYRTLPIRELFGEIVNRAVTHNRRARPVRVQFRHSPNYDLFDDLMSGWVLSRLGAETPIQVSERQIDVVYQGVTASLCWEKLHDHGECLAVSFSDGTSASIAQVGMGVDQGFEASFGGVTISRTLASYPLAAYVLRTLQDRVEFEEYASSCRHFIKIKGVLAASGRL